MPATNVLFVDDEAALRQTFPALLEPHGFRVEVAASVTEALERIRSQPFDVLISDLNIGEPGDGFTLVSAMRRTHPTCRNFIITGYPAFETALEAIRSQVDAFFVKPTDVSTLLASLTGATELPVVRDVPKLHISDLLRREVEGIGARALEYLRTNSTIRWLPATATESFPNVSALVLGLADRLQSAAPSQPSELGFKAAFEHGRARHAQGYSMLALLEDAHAIHHAIFDTVEQNLMSVDLSCLIADLRNLANVVEGLLTGAILGFLAQEVQTSRNLLGRFWNLIKEEIENPITEELENPKDNDDTPTAEVA